MIKIVNESGVKQCSDYHNLAEAMHDIKVNDCKVLNTVMDLESETLTIVIEVKEQPH